MEDLTHSNSSTSNCPYLGKSSQPSKEIFGQQLPPGCEMSVRLRKDQIDKASKDHSGRFAQDFTVTLVVFKPDDPTSVPHEGCKPSGHTQSISTGQVGCDGREKIQIL